MSFEAQVEHIHQIQQSSMPCPRCNAMHRHGESFCWKPDRPDGPTVVAPKDVLCDCGLILTVVVPLFKTSEFGWNWGIKPDSQSPRFHR